MNEPTDQDYRDDSELQHFDWMHLEAFVRDSLTEPEREDLYRHTHTEQCRRCRGALAAVFLLLAASEDLETMAALERAKSWYRKRMDGRIQ